MAKDYNLKITIDSSGAVNSIDGIRQGLDDVGNSAKNAQEKLDGFDKPTNSVKSLKAEIRALQNQLLSGAIPEGTKQYDDMSKKLAELKDRQKDFGENITANVGNPVERTSQNFALLKDRLFSLDFEGASASAKGLANSIKSISFKEMTTGIKESATAFGQLAKAIMLNPFVLMLSAIALAIAGIYLAFQLAEKNVIDSTNRMISEVDRLAEARRREERKELAEAQGNSQKIYEAKVSANRAIQADNARKILAILEQEKQGVELTEEQYKILTEARQKNADAQVDLEILKIERINALNQAQFDLERRYQQVGMSDREKAYSDLTNQYADQEKKLRELGASEQDIATLRMIQQDEERKLNEKYAKEDADKAKAIKDKKIADAKVIADALKEAKQTQMNEEIAMEEDLTERIRRAKMSDKDVRIEQIQDEYFTLIETARTLGMDYIALEQERDRKITEIRVEGAKERQQLLNQIEQEQIAEEEMLQQLSLDAGKTDAELKLQSLQEEYFQQKTLMEQNGIDTTNLTQQFEQNKTLIELEERQKRVDNQVEWANKGIALISAFSAFGDTKTEEGRRKAFNRAKAFQIAQATSDTYSAANKAYLSQMALTTPDAPIRATIAAGVAIAFGIANVGKIAATKYEGGGTNNTPPPPPSTGGLNGGGGGGQSSGGQTTASFNPLVSSFIGNRPSQITKAYVLAGDVASSTEARDKVENLARIG